MKIEVIKGNPVEIYDKEVVTSSEAARILNLTRARIVQLFNYNNEDSSKGIPNFRFRNFRATTLKDVIDFQKKRVKKLTGV